jgi:outer membrane murein-binding lipoprotein Lpp
VIRAFFVISYFLPQELVDMSTAKSLFIRRESDVWESLRSWWAALTEANERLAQWSAEVAGLRLLCDELKSKAAAARTEVAAARTEAASARTEASSTQEQVASQAK